MPSVTAFAQRISAGRHRRDGNSSVAGDHCTNFGQRAAVAELETRGDLVITLIADLQTRAGEIPALFGARRFRRGQAHHSASAWDSAWRFMSRASVDLAVAAPPGRHAGPMWLRAARHRDATSIKRC